MNFQELDIYLGGKKGVTFDYPFDEKVRVYRIENKIFALMVDEIPIKINLKCDPFYALELRSLYRCINAGYHMNKKHWNTVEINGDVEDGIVKELINHSYQLVFYSLSKKQQVALL